MRRFLAIGVCCIIPSVANAAAAPGSPQPCNNFTLAVNTPIMILDSIAGRVSGVPTGRVGGGFQVPTAATAPVEYIWSDEPQFAGPLTTTPGGQVFSAAAGAFVSFVDAPKTELWAISSAAVVLSCQQSK